jgi:hypothetical protein
MDHGIEGIGQHPATTRHRRSSKDCRKADGRDRRYNPAGPPRDNAAITPLLALNGRVEQRLTILELMLTLGRRLEASPWDRYSKPWD